MAVNGRAKGSSFEREVARLVIDTFAHHGITKVDCYRTPMSGGHFAASKVDPGDLLISPKLREHFAYAVECKSYFDLQWRVILSDKDVKGKLDAWWKQCLKAAGETGLKPMLVFKQNMGQIYAMMHPAAFPKDFKPSVSIRIRCGARVRIVLFKELLSYLGAK